MPHNQGADESAPKRIKEAALRLLAYREHSQKELLNKLMAKGFEVSDIQPVLQALAEQNWQSDLRYAQSYTRHRLQKGYGALAIAHELKQNGINAFDIDAVLLELELDWLSLIQQVYEKKYGLLCKLSAPERAKRSRFLLQRGFSSALIQQLFKQNP